MQKAQIPEGSKFGRLVVVGPAGFKTAPNGVRRSAYRCRCDCGAEVIATGTLLLSGEVKSCGCHRRDRMKHLNYKHGDTGSRLYTIWIGMRQRCSKDDLASSVYYKKRGIKVCTLWNRSWAAFKRWALANGYRDDLTLGRIDNNKNYGPKNCRWETVLQQNNNQQRTTWVDTPVGRMSLSDAVRKYRVVCMNTARARVFHGWDPWLAVSTPRIPNNQRKRGRPNGIQDS